MDMLSVIHSHNRWLIFAFGLLSLLATLPAFFGKKPLSSAALLIMRIYVWIVTLQFVIGVVQLIARWDDAGSMLRHRLEHAFCMLLVLGVLHMRKRWMKGPDPVIARNAMLVMLTSIILIVLGITVITAAKGATIFG